MSSRAGEREGVCQIQSSMFGVRMGMGMMGCEKYMTPYMRVILSNSRNMEVETIPPVHKEE